MTIERKPVTFGDLRAWIRAVAQKSPRILGTSEF